MSDVHDLLLEASTIPSRVDGRSLVDQSAVV